MNEQPLSLPEIHKETLNILQKIIDICKAIGINYYIAYGSLIGAVRHKGFIPWDDDMDIIMLRPDYNKFKEYCETNEKNLFPFRFMDRHNTPNFPFTLARFCDLRYKMVSEEITDAGMGMFIDIYPFDGAGNTPTEAENKIKFRKWLNLNCAFTTLRRGFKKSHRGILGTILKLPVHCFAKIMGTDYFLDNLEKLQYTFSFEDSEYIGCMVWDWPIKVKKKSDYSDYIYLDFEGMKVKAPIGYDEVLRSSYGDYMQLPPEDKRAPHHEYMLYRKPEYFNQEG